MESRPTWGTHSGPTRLPCLWGAVDPPMLAGGSPDHLCDKKRVLRPASSKSEPLLGSSVARACAPSECPSRLHALVHAPKACPRAEAHSVAHLLTHWPKNPYCDSRQIAKAQRVPARQRLGLHPTLSRFGVLARDHIIATSLESQGQTTTQGFENS